MAGYENLLVIFYHSALPVYESQQIKYKIIDCGGLCSKQNTLYKTVMDGEAPMQKYTNLMWVGFSEEGLLCSLNDNGVVSGLNMKSEQWVPIIDLKTQYAETYKNFWLAGIMDNELLVLELPSQFDQPPMRMRPIYKRIPLHFPLLNLEAKQGAATTSSTAATDNAAAYEEQYLRNQFALDHEQYRKDNWETLKTVRSETDNERAQSGSIFEPKDIVAKKKELDKLVLNAIRLAIVNDEQEKVFTYLELLHFTQSLKLCIKLCNNLKADRLAQRVSMFISDKETREMHDSQRMQAAVAASASKNDSRQVARCLKMTEGRGAMERAGKTDLAQFAVSKPSPYSAVVADASHDAAMSESNLGEAPMSTSGPQQPNGDVAQHHQQPPRQMKANPFARTSHDLAKKAAAAPSMAGSNKDIFSDLHKPSSNAVAPGLKRANPFADSAQRLIPRSMKHK